MKAGQVNDSEVVLTTPKTQSSYMILMNLEGHSYTGFKPLQLPSREFQLKKPLDESWNLFKKVK